jgi:hypothetical protein
MSRTILAPRSRRAPLLRAPHRRPAPRQLTEGGFVAAVPELPGCMSDGAQEALENAYDAIGCWIEACGKKWACRCRNRSGRRPESILKMGASRPPFHNARQELDKAPKLSRVRSSRPASRKQVMMVVLATL